MTLNGFRNYCLSKKGVVADFPFDEKTLVMKVLGKMFALTNIDSGMEMGKHVPAFYSINLKFNPDTIQDFRSKHEAVVPGYHMNKKHWNSVIMDGSINDTTIKKWIDNSYTLVVKNMTKKMKAKLEAM